MSNTIPYLSCKKNDPKSYRKSSPILAGPIFLLVLVLWACGESTPNPTITKPLPISEITSRSWRGVSTIPDYGFVDSREKKINCFSFTDVAAGSNVTLYDWKSDIYSNNNSPQEVWFHSTNNMDAEPVSTSPVGDTALYFILRYNITDTHLDRYVMSNAENYSVKFVLDKVSSQVGTNTGGDPTFEEYSLYMPVVVRNFATNAGGEVTMDVNFAVTFAARPRSNQLLEGRWSEIYDSLKGSLIGDMNIISPYWTTYTAVTNVENGAGGCPNN